MTNDTPVWVVVELLDAAPAVVDAVVLGAPVWVVVPVEASMPAFAACVGSSTRWQADVPKAHRPRSVRQLAAVR
jgi:hypothetical protein